MASTLNPYIQFQDTTRDAMEFYRAALGGTLAMNTFGEFGQAGTPVENLIMHATLETPAGFTLMASDTPPGMDRQAGSSISISLSGDDESELRGYWEALGEGATVTVPLEKQMWGDTFGALIDRFGVSWMVNIGSAS